MGMRAVRLRIWPARRPREVKSSCTGPPECNFSTSAIQRSTTNDRDPKSSWMHGYILRVLMERSTRGAPSILMTALRLKTTSGERLYDEPPAVELIWWAEFDRTDAAFALEKQLQGCGRDRHLALVNGWFGAIKGWSARERALRQEVSSQG